MIYCVNSFFLFCGFSVARRRWSKSPIETPKYTVFKKNVNPEDKFPMQWVSDTSTTDTNVFSQLSLIIYFFLKPPQNTAAPAREYKPEQNRGNLDKQLRESW